MLLTDDAAWTRALERAHAEGIRVKRICGSVDSDTQTFTATASRSKRFAYAVEVHCGPDGVEVRCGCNAGKREALICKHSSLALEMAGFLSLNTANVGA